MFATRTFAQFPLSEPVTGDTVYENITDGTLRISHPWNDGLLMILYTSTTSRLIQLTDDGAISSDASIPSPGLRSFGSLVTADGLLVAGSTWVSVTNQASVAKVGSDLQGYEWMDTSGTGGITHIFISLKELSNGDLLAAGYWLFDGTTYRPYVRRLTADGDPIWTYSSTNPYVRYLNDARELPDGSLLFTGVNGPPINNEIKLYGLKLSATGDFLTDEDIGTGGFQRGIKVMAHPNGHSIFWGYRDSPASLFMCEVDDQSLPISTNFISGLKFGDALFDPISSTFVVTGRKLGVGLFVGRFNLQGDTLWTRTFGVPSAEGRHIQHDGFGGYLVSGSVGNGSFADPIKPYLVRVDQDGLITGTNERNTQEQKITLVPNPTMHRSTLVVNGAWAPVRWELFNLTGHRLRAGIFTPTVATTISADGLTSGIYFVNVIGSDNSSYALRWVVE